MKRKLTSCLLVAGFMLATAPSVLAETYFIKVDGSDGTDGSSWEQAISYDYFAENMEQGNFADGDVFCFAGGVYKLSSPDFDKYLAINRSVTLLGGFDPASTGTNTDITYPSPYETVISGAIESDVAAVPGNRTHLWYIQNATVTPTDTVRVRLNVTVKGFTFKHAFRNYDSASDYKGAVMVFDTDLDMQWCKFIQNGAAYVGPSGLDVIASHADISDCVFSENFSGEKGAALGLFTVKLYSEKQYKTTAVVQRCQFTDNYFTTDYYPEAEYDGGKPPYTNKLRGSAIFLGSNDERISLYLVNSLVADNYTEGFGVIMGYPGTTMYMVSNTIANKDYTAEQEARTVGSNNSGGKDVGRGLGVMSYGGFNYMANNYIVNGVLGESAPSNTAILLSRSNDKRPGTWNSGGYNLSGTAWYCTNWATPRDRTQTPEVQATSFLYFGNNDAETYTYADVFGETTFGDNGGNTQTLVPTTRMSSLTLDELNALKTEWSLPENIDLTVDQRGYKRAATTCVGAYDGDATSGITDLTNVSKVSVSTLGNGIFQVNGADTDVTVYNLSGNVVKVVPANEVIDLSSAAKGVYIMTVGGQAFKVIK
jgi:hypothetical protein